MSLISFIKNKIKIEKSDYEIKYITHKEAIDTYLIDPNWIDIHRYGTRQDIDDGEIGILNNVRYFIQ